jgi:hypothetical protein
MTTLARLSAIALAVALVHCAQGGTGQAPDLDAGPLAPDPGPEGGTFAEAAAPSPITGVECAEETKQIYVLGTDRTLYRFYPDALKFVRVGAIGCPTAAGTFSMAIDRRGTAWVEFTDGHVYAVDTGNATCKPTSFRAGQTGFENFGMGYALNGDAANGETLYVAGAGLASLDTTTFDLTFLGSMAVGRTELTGMGTRLFSFNVGSGVIAELDKTNAATLASHRTSAVDPAAAFAFAQWGGAFWIFTGSDRSIVTRYAPADDTSSVVVKDTGMLIVGAGSSTCAPTKPN